MMSTEEATKARRRAQRLNDLLGSANAPDPETGRSIVVRPVKRKTYPTAADRVFAARLVKVDAAEAEGAPVTLTPDPDNVIYVINVGKQVPPENNTDLIADPIDGFYVVVFNG